MSSRLRSPSIGDPVHSPTAIFRPRAERPATVPFDLWDQAVQAAGHLEQLCRGLSGQVRILDVSHATEQSLAGLAVPDRLHVVRCDELNLDEPLPFDDGAFDAVVALDTIRHVAPERRDAVLAELLRVTKRGLVLSAPDGGRALVAEQLVGRPPQSLSPSEATMREMLGRFDAPFGVFRGISLDRWLAIQLLSDAGSTIALDEELQGTLHSRVLEQPSDESSGAYRNLYVVATHFDASDALEQAVEPLPACEPSKELTAALKHLAASAVGLLANQNEATRHEPAALREVIRELTRSRGDYDLRHWILLSFADAVTASAGWRVLSPLRALKKLIRPRGFSRDDLRPWKDLQPLPEPGGFQAIGPDPQLVVCCWLPAGWIRIRLKAQVAHKSRLEIYAERDGAFDPVTLLGQFTLAAGDNDEEFFLHLDQPTRAIRIDPLDGPGEIRIERLDVTPRSGLHTVFDALRRKLRLLRSYHNTGPVLRKGLKLLLTGQWRDVGRKWALGLNDPRCTRHGFYEPEKAYERWIAAHRMTDADRATHREWAAGLADPPVISVIMPTFNTPEKYLRLAIESVLRQSYPHWELCIADDGSTQPHVRTVLEEYAQRDSRVKLTPAGKHGGISAASNAAIGLANGRFLAFLDHDDEIAEYALERFARSIVDTPDVDMLYSDEDKLRPDGQRMTPFFKPDWSPEFFLGCMYTCHLSAYRTDMVRSVGGLRSEYDGAQDYDLALRISEQARRIVHVPDILYHWRLLPNSTATSVAAKPEAHAAAMRALEDHLRRTDKPGRVDVGPSAGLSYTRPTVRGTPKVSIIIPSQCRMDAAPGRAVSHLENCIASIATRSSWTNYEIIVLDGDTMSPAMQRKLLNDRVHRVNYQHSFNWSMVNNLGARHSRGEYLLFLNDDMEIISKDWIESLLEFAQQKEIGAVGGKLIFPDGSLQHVGVAVLDGKPGHPFYGHPRDHAGYFSRNLLPHNCAAVTGACLMTRADVFCAAGGFDEGLPLNYNDIDYCFRVRDLGFRVVYTPHAELIHFEGASKPGVLPGEMDAFGERWGMHVGDPYYNVNLNMETFDYRIG